MLGKWYGINSTSVGDRINLAAFDNLESPTSEGQGNQSLLAAGGTAAHSTDDSHL